MNANRGGRHVKHYNHDVLCSGNRALPIGSSGCCCMHILKQVFEDSVRKKPAMSQKERDDVFGPFI